MRDIERDEGVGCSGLAQHFLSAFGDLEGWHRLERTAHSAGAS